jgi:hypothetical protein
MLTTRSVPAVAAWHRRPAVRWLVTFAAFPLGSVLARALAGPVDTTVAAVAGGLINGAVIGAAQGWALRPSGIPAIRWAVATALGLGVGLGIGATAVDFGTSAGALAVQGALCGLFVGLAQALLLTSAIGRWAGAWPLALGALWALGWTITGAVGVEVDERFTVFGSSGAVTVTVLTAVLPLALARQAGR